jgi:hypothetical protein
MVQETGQKGNFQGDAGIDADYCYCCGDEIAEQECFFCGKRVCPHCCEERAVGYAKYGSEVYYGEFCEGCLARFQVKSLLQEIKFGDKPKFEGNRENVSRKEWKDAIEGGLK